MNNEYWEKRKAQRMWEHMQSAEKTGKEVARVYLKSFQYLDKEMQGIFDKYKKKHGISEAEAIRILNSVNNSSFEEMLVKLKASHLSEDKKDLIKLLEAPAYRSRINRLQTLQSNIDLMMNSVYKQEKKISTKGYTKIAKDAYYKSIFDVQKDTGLGFSFNQLDQKQIDKVLNSKWSGKNYSARIWNNTQELAKDVKEQLLLGMMTGKTEKEMSQTLMKKYSVGAFEARRLIRTESCYIANEMEAQSFEECGADKYIFCATLDLRTSEKCIEHDGKRYKLKKRRAGENFPPLHPFCRSTVIMDIADEILGNLKRRARNPETNKNYVVPANTTYRDWYNGLEEQEDGTLRYALDIQFFSSILSPLFENEERALKKYIGPDAYKLNDKLRNHIELTEVEKEWIEDLDSALEKMPIYEGEVVRVLDFYFDEDLHDFYNGIEVGKTKSWEQYLSSSYKDGYNPKAQIIIYIKSKTGKDISLYNPKESEVLFERNTEFTVTKKEEKNGKIKIWMEE